MSQELTYNVNVRFNKSGFDTGQATLASNQKYDITGTKCSRLVQSVGFSAREAVEMGEVTAPGHLIIKNLDATNYVEVWTDATSGTGVAKLLPGAAPTGGEFCVIPTHVDMIAPGVKAATAACLIEVIVVER